MKGKNWNQGQEWVVHFLIPPLGRLRQDRPDFFKDSLGYISKTQSQNDYFLKCLKPEKQGTAIIRANRRLTQMTMR